MKSLKGTKASLRAEQTSEDEHEIHSTKVGYKAITCAHVLASTATKGKECYFFLMLQLLFFYTEKYVCN